MAFSYNINHKSNCNINIITIILNKSIVFSLINFIISLSIISKSVSQENYYYTKYESYSNINTTATTVTNDSLQQSQCVCDLTPNACDYNCCCDLECPVVLLTQWLLDANNVCIDKQTSEKNVFTYCFDSNYLVEFNIKRGMKDYTEGDYFCVSFDNSSKKAQYYSNIMTLDSTTLYSAYDNLFSTRTTRYLNYIYENRTEYMNSHANYNIDDYIWIRELIDEVSNTTVQNKFKVMKEGVNGECVRSIPVGFLKDVSEKSCGLVIVRAEFFIMLYLLLQCYYLLILLQNQLNQCESHNWQYDSLLTKSFWAVNSNFTSLITPTIYRVDVKNSTNLYTTYTSSNFTINNFATKLSKSGSTCQCDNILEEVHYRLFIDDNYMMLTSVEMDIVLATKIIGACTSRKIRKFKTSVTYHQMDNRNVSYKHI